MMHQNSKDKLEEVTIDDADKNRERWLLRKLIDYKGDLMAGRTGLEPATSGLTGQRSNQLNYRPLIKK